MDEHCRYIFAVITVTSHFVESNKMASPGGHHETTDLIAGLHERQIAHLPQPYFYTTKDHGMHDGKSTIKRARY